VALALLLVLALALLLSLRLVLVPVSRWKRQAQVGRSGGLVAEVVEGEEQGSYEDIRSPREPGHHHLPQQHPHKCKRHC